MESYLMEIKQLRIPRPKYEPNGSPPNATAWHCFVRPFTPPRDYHLPATEVTVAMRPRKFPSSGSDEFRPSLHNKM